jgi:predicted nucleic acid-binding protein
VILVDTSVWVDHLRRDNAELGRRLLDGDVMSHPFVVGELACGHLAKRGELLSLLQTLPAVPMARHAEVLELVGARRLYGRGLGWVDVHLLASAVLSQTPIWTLDKKLDAVARRLGISA